MNYNEQTYISIQKIIKHNKKSRMRYRSYQDGQIKLGKCYVSTGLDY